MSNTKAKPAPSPDPRVTVTLPRPRANEARELFVAVNGREFLIPKGVPVRVPPCVAEELRRAEAAEARMDERRERLLEAGRRPANL
jgi:hypothetical protein